jgi:hypothetical protein
MLSQVISILSYIGEFALFTAAAGAMALAALGLR